MSEAAQNPKLRQQLSGQGHELLPRFAENYRGLRALPRLLIMEVMMAARLALQRNVVRLAFWILILGGILILEPVAAMADVPLPLGSEFQVNTYVTGNQRDPSVAPLPGGGYVVVWSDDNRGEIVGLHYDENGAPVGSEFQVASASLGDPSVAAAPTGEFVVVWQPRQGITGSAPNERYVGEVAARLYDSSGNPVGSEFVVNTNQTEDQSAPSVAMFPGGGFVVAWHSFAQDSDGDDYGIYARLYDSDGNALGLEFQVNTSTEGDQARPSVAAGPGGEFTVVWESDGPDTSGFDILGQRYDSSGNPVGPEFKVNTHTTDEQIRPAIAAGPQGELVVVWQSFGQDGNNFGIYGRRYDSSGTPDGSEFKVNSSTIGSQAHPAVAFGPTGDWLVAWDNYHLQGDLYGNLKDVFAQLYDESGNKVGDEFRVNSFIANYQDRPAVAFASSGSFLVVWQSNTQENSYIGQYGVFGRRFDATLSPVPTPTPTSNTAILVKNPYMTFRFIATNFCPDCNFCDCPPQCAWYDGADPSELISLYSQRWFAAPPSNMQAWGFISQNVVAERNQSGVGIDPLPLREVTLGQEFPLLTFTSINWPIIGVYPTSLRIIALLHVEPPGEPAFDFPICSIPLTFIETDNTSSLSGCDPAIQRSDVPCDDEYSIVPQSFQFAANGKVWNLDVLGWDDPWSPGTVTTQLVVEEATETSTPLLAVLTVEAEDGDGDGFFSGEDCDDTDPNVHPGAPEVCDGVDNNCDGQIDEGVKTTFYQDADHDGFGNPAASTQACTAPAGYVSNSGDCNDSNGAIHPGATEVCDGVDNNCDGQIDEGVKITFYQDADHDGFGNPAATTQACTAPAGYVSDNTDCNDSSGTTHPGALELCADNVDNDCDALVDSADADCTPTDLAVTKTAPATLQIQVGGQANLTYTIGVKNTGPGAANSIVLTDTLPNGTTFVSASPSQGNCSTPAVGSGGTVQCAVGSLSNGSSATLKLVVKVRQSLLTLKTLTNTAAVSSNTPDPNSANNSDTAKTKVVTVLNN